jgi:Flp pilus assembly protein TadG
MKKQNTRRRSFRAQNMVEFAIVSPLLFLLFFGILEGGWLFYNQNEITDAAREGARYAAVHGTVAEDISDDDVSTYEVPSSDVKNAILEHLSIPNASDIQVTVSRPDGDMVPGHRVKVQVTFLYHPLIGYAFGSATVTLSSSSTSIIYY